MLVPLEFAALRRFRHNLRNKLQAVSASHIAEALAAAVGLNSAIALRDLERNAGPDVFRAPDPAKFAERLRGLGHLVSTQAAHEALTHAWQAEQPPALTTSPSRPGQTAGIRRAYLRAQWALIEEAYDRWGLIAFGGRAGSGKTTTMNALLREKLGPEDEVLYVGHPGDVTFPRPVHSMSENPARLDWEAAMRRDPNVFVFGELRDQWTAQHAMTAAATGNLALTTVLISGVTDLVQRLEGMGIADPARFDASAFGAIVAQRLLPGLCPHCSLPWHEAKQTPLLSPTRRIEALAGEALLARVRVARKGGCPICRNARGWSGREVAAEVIRPDQTFMEHVQGGRKAEAVAHWKAELSGMTMDEHALAKVLAGLVDPAILEQYGEGDTVASDRLPLIAAAADELAQDA